MIVVYDTIFVKGNVYVGRNGYMIRENFSEKTDEELTREGSDPYAMLRYSVVVLNDPDNGGFGKALEIVKRARQLFPENLDVIHAYCILLNIDGHSVTQIGTMGPAYDMASDSFREALGLVDILKLRGYDTEKVRNLEIDICMEYGELAYKNDELELALNLLERTDKNRYPYSVLLIFNIHLHYISRYETEILSDIRELHRVLSMNTWRTPLEKAMTYANLSVLYAIGIPDIVKKDVNFAYECICKCAEIDPEYAEEEMRKYSKGLFGKIKYKG